MILGGDLPAERYGLPELPSLAAYLAHWAEVDGERPCLTFVDYAADRAGVNRVVSYRDMDLRVGAAAARLQRLARVGERVAILAPQGIEYLVAFLAAARAGLISVPLFTPDLPGHGDRLDVVLADCAPAVVVTTPPQVGQVDALLDRVAAGEARPAVLELDAVGTDVAADAADAAAFGPVGIDPDMTAYLQYTSGSTRAPAGVRITHANVIADSRNAREAYDLRRDATTPVSWLPLFHDMGLVFVAGALALGGMHAVLLDPLAFIARPVRWLQQLSAYPGTVAMAPNFAYDYCAKRVGDADRAALRLENVQALVNGAEPIHADSLARFYDAFSGAGLRPHVVRPSYGLAEATVYVCGSLTDRPHTEAVFDADLIATGEARPAGPATERTRRLVGCGVPVGQRIAIVDPESGRVRADGEIGEIWIHGGNVAPGYWQNDELTAHSFGAVLADADLGAPTADGSPVPAGPWLRTEDLGAVHAGELYVTGRMKDLIIVDGRNLYPQDLEATTEAAHGAVARHRVAAFAVSGDEVAGAGRDSRAGAGDGEGVVLVAEISRHAADWDPHEVARTVRKAISSDHAVSVHDVVLVAPDEVPMTSSGKIARSASKQRYLGGELRPAEAAT